MNGRAFLIPLTQHTVAAYLRLNLSELFLSACPFPLPPPSLLPPSHQPADYPLSCPAPGSRACAWIACPFASYLMSKSIIFFLADYQ